MGTIRMLRDDGLPLCCPGCAHDRWLGDTADRERGRIVLIMCAGCHVMCRINSPVRVVA